MSDPKQFAGPDPSGRNAVLLRNNREIRRDDWKARQALTVPQPRYVEPTVHDRIQRLNPMERREVRTLVRSMYLRKVVRSVLAQAYWLGQPLGPDSRPSTSTSTQRSQRTVKAHESLLNYERALTPSVDATTFEPTVSVQTADGTVIMPYNN